VKDTATDYNQHIAYSVPIGATLTDFGHRIVIGAGTSVTIPVNFTWTTQNVFGDSNVFAAQFESVTWSVDWGTSFARQFTDSSMANDVNWRTPIMYGIGGASAIPEPSTYAAIIGAFGFIFVLWRKRSVV
jgi:hypothetical protein